MQSKVLKEALGALQAVHNESKRDQFLMKLRPEFESVCAGLINRKPVPTLDECLGELLREEQPVASQHGIAKTLSVLRYSIWLMQLKEKVDSNPRHNATVARSLGI